jgi:uncharacterized protein
MLLVFEWDQRKAQANVRKHGVSFDEAASVFGDPLARIFVDEDHSAEERREIIVGHSKRLLVVSFTERVKGRVRIINARCATRGEQRDYEEHVTS